MPIHRLRMKQSNDLHVLLFYEKKVPMAIVENKHYSSCQVNQLSTNVWWTIARTDLNIDSIILLIIIHCLQNRQFANNSSIFCQRWWTISKPILPSCISLRWFSCKSIANIVHIRWCIHSCHGRSCLPYLKKKTFSSLSSSSFFSQYLNVKIIRDNIIYNWSMSYFSFACRWQRQQRTMTRIGMIVEWHE